MKTRRISIGAIFSALAAMLLYLSGALNLGSIALCAAAGIMPYIVAESCGGYFGLLSYFCVSLLGLILTPNKIYVLAFALCFGIYPLLKRCLDMMGSWGYRWTAKIILANLFFLIVYRFLGEIFLNYAYPNGGVFLIAAVWNIVFIFYDIGVSQVMRVYKRRIGKNIK